MSALLQTFADGTVAYRNGTGVPTGFTNGLPVDTGALAVDGATAIDHHHQGLPYTANGRLAVSIGGSVSFYNHGAAPIDAGGRLVIDTGAAAAFTSGVPYTGTGEVAGSVAP